MNAIQKTAIVETAKTCAGLASLAIVIPAAILLIPLEVLGGIVSIAALVFATKMIYDIKLGQAKAKQAEIDAKIDRLHK
jgi:uncharacterized membrane protein